MTRGTDSRIDIPEQWQRRFAVLQMRVEDLLIEIFRARWRAVEAELANGIDVAARQQTCFFAADTVMQLRSARRYYARSRASRLARASVREIRRLSPWFNDFCWHADDLGLTERELRRNIQSIVNSEYVVWCWNAPEAFEYTRVMDNFTIGGLTQEGFDDVYDNTVGHYGALLEVCKSASAPFGAFERMQAMTGIKKAFHDSDIGAAFGPSGWRILFRTAENSCFIKAVVGPPRTTKRKPTRSS